VSRWLALLPEAALVVTGLLIFAALMSDRHRERWARRAAELGGVLLLLACLLTLGRSVEVFWVTYRVDVFSQYVKLAMCSSACPR